MQTLALPKPECASPVSAYSECSCDYCGHEIMFLHDAEGQSVECPHCAKSIRLGSVNLSAALEMHIITGERVQRIQQSRLRRMAQVAGGPAFFAGLIVLLGLMVTPFSAQETLTRGAALVGTLGLIASGLVMMIEGRRITSNWVCSVCQHPLGAKDSLVCSCCQAELR